MLPDLRFEVLQSNFRKKRIPVGALRSERVVGVGCGKDPSAKSDLISSQSGRVPTAVPFLVMMLEVRKRRFDVRQGSEDVHSNLDVLFDVLELVEGERFRLVKH